MTSQEVEETMMASHFAVRQGPLLTQVFGAAFALAAVTWDYAWVTDERGVSSAAFATVTAILGLIGVVALSVGVVAQLPRPGPGPALAFFYGVAGAITLLGCALTFSSEGGPNIGGTMVLILARYALVAAAAVGLLTVLASIAFPRTMGAAAREDSGGS